MVLRRLYVHNFRCLENFELSLAGQPSVLLIGKNGSGKSTIARVLENLQKIGRGTSRVGSLLGDKDITRGHSDVPVRFEIEAEQEGVIYAYQIAFDLPEGFKELRVLEEKLSVSGKPVYAREGAQVTLSKSGKDGASKFRIDGHMVALPIVEEKSLLIFRQSLARMLILRPIPAYITGESNSDTLEPGPEVRDFGAWFTGLLAYSPAAYSGIAGYLRQVMPDLEDVKNPLVGKDARSLVVQFSSKLGSLSVAFADLSDGEKCFMICALVLAANKASGNLLCFWDEPDNYLALSEVGHFVIALRQAFKSGSQLIATSHNPEAIRRFSDENTMVLHRNSHLEPTVVRPSGDLKVKGDLVNALISDDLPWG